MGGIFCLLLAASCNRVKWTTADKATESVPSSVVSPVPVTSAIPTAVHDAVAPDATADAALPCETMALQDRCVPRAGPLHEGTAEAWFTKLGAKAPEVDLEACGEVKGGSGDTTSMYLACVVGVAVPVPSSLGADGPTELHYAATLFTVRSGKAVKLMSAPIGVFANEQLYRGTFKVDPDARVVAVDVSDCKAAQARHGAYWTKQIAEAKKNSPDSVPGVKGDQALSAKQLAVICRTKARYAFE